ncbi:hypothetical protein F5148DRAFT_633967 [Russula earlei]|uniref:Uncharacterized protein n=1 Tax=Russula earlei TaxID=71964 RepID=A0ACC0TVG0_9AGAM|nr:hypothetical protein F5148DRAFT_633967 [Russula earlei]
MTQPSRRWRGFNGCLSRSRDAHVRGHSHRFQIPQISISLAFFSPVRVRFPFIFPVVLLLIFFLLSFSLIHSILECLMSLLCLPRARFSHVTVTRCIIPFRFCELSPPFPQVLQVPSMLDTRMAKFACFPSCHCETHQEVFYDVVNGPLSHGGDARCCDGTSNDSGYKNLSGHMCATPVCFLFKISAPFPQNTTTRLALQLRHRGPR